MSCVDQNMNRGIALVGVLLVSSLVLVVSLGLALVLALTHLIVRNQREATLLRHAAIAGVERATAAMADLDWNDVLAGGVQAAESDGPPTGSRQLDGGAEVDLDRETSLLNCGQPRACTDAELDAVTAQRPWGSNNPRWRLVLNAPIQALAAFRFPPAAYVLVWMADDGREQDGEPERDGTAGEAGSSVLQVHAVALGRGGGRRGVEAELVRICRPPVDGAACLPGIRVQSWRDLRQVVP